LGRVEKEEAAFKAIEEHEAAVGDLAQQALKIRADRTHRIKTDSRETG